MPSEIQRYQQRTRKLFQNAIANTLKIPEKLSVSQWAEKYRVLEGSSNFSGKWSNDLTPYLIGIMDAFNDPYIQEINFCKSTQVGGTEAIINMLGYIITQSQATTLLVYPTDEMAKEISGERIKPPLLKTPEIKRFFLDKRSKELRLRFTGMTLFLTGAGNANKLASRPVKYLFFDEIDKLDGASKKEASPYNLAKERTRTYTYSKKIITCSTPTLKTNYVWMIHENADEQRKYYVPCPHCNEFQLLEFDQIIFSQDKSLSVSDRAKTAEYVCPECGCIITDYEKAGMLRRGEWRTENKKCNGHPRSVSFWINCLYSRFLTWEDIAREFLKSKDNPEELQNFINSWLAKPWENTKTKTSRETVMERRTDLSMYVVPDWTKLLTGGVDVQEDCVYWTIRAWGNYITSQCIAHGQARSLSEIEKIMNMQYRMTSGEQMVVQLCLVDSGDQTDMVYQFIAKNNEWAYPCKGSSHAMLSDFKLSTINKVNSVANGLQLVLIDTDKYKDYISSRMRRNNGKGAWMVYAECDEEYAEQVTAEHKVYIKNKSGNKDLKWVPKHTHIDNHYLDCEVYAYTAADIMGVRMLHLQNEEPQQETLEQTDEEIWIEKNEKWI